MREVGLQCKVLDVLRIGGGPMTAFQVAGHLAALPYYTTETSVRVTMSRLKNKGFVRITPSETCACCGRRGTYYVLTYKGRNYEHVPDAPLAPTCTPEPVV